jgi:GT2 family glycosyltransferase
VNRVGIIVIGRNEGDRLKRSLQSVIALDLPTIYADSGSTDQSVKYAESLGISVVKVDMSIPPNASRARNLGFQQLLLKYPYIEYVQFLDGDSRLIKEWIHEGLEIFFENPPVAIVCGTIHEDMQSPSVYSRLFELEWRKTNGEIAACSGIMLIRSSVFNDVKGFDPQIIAAEDDDLCIRVRQKGWKILKIESHMATHEANISSFSQGFTSERHFVRQTLSAIAWGFILPLCALVPVFWTHGRSLLFLFGYPILFFRILYNSYKKNWTLNEGLLYAFYGTIAKFAHVIGIVKYLWDKIRGKQAKIIEYKGIP